MASEQALRLFPSAAFGAGGLAVVGVAVGFGWVEGSTLGSGVLGSGVLVVKSVEPGVLLESEAVGVLGAGVPVSSLPPHAGRRVSAAATVATVRNIASDLREFRLLRLANLTEYRSKA